MPRALLESGLVPGREILEIEDGAFVGSRCIVVEGARVRRGAKLGAGVILSSSIPVIDVETGEEISRGDVPERAVALHLGEPQRIERELLLLDRGQRSPPRAQAERRPFRIRSPWRDKADGPDGEPFVATGDLLTDSFAPWETHIYKFPNPTAPCEIDCTSVTAVPEPSSLGLAIALVLLTFRRHRQK